MNRTTVEKEAELISAACKESVLFMARYGRMSDNAMPSKESQQTSAISKGKKVMLPVGHPMRGYTAYSVEEVNLASQPPDTILRIFDAYRITEVTRIYEVPRYRVVAMIHYFNSHAAKCELRLIIPTLRRNAPNLALNHTK